MHKSRSSDYWSEWTDDDIEYYIESHKANIRHHQNQIKRMEQELKERKDYDASIS